MLIAKSNPIETIEVHTEHLLEGFEDVKKLYGNIFTDEELEFIKLASMYHDYGKSNFNFQKMIKKKANIKFVDEELIFKSVIEKMYSKIKDGDKIPHGYLSPAFINLSELEKIYDKQKIRILINAIYFHHTREYNYSDKEIKMMIDEDLKKRLQFKLQSRYCSMVYNNKCVIEDNEWVNFAVIKGMLNKLDYWASSDRKEKIEINPKYNNQYIDEIIEQKICTEYGKLRDVQTYMKNNKDNNLVVIASTGIGKTEAALMWVGSCKVFYTLPLKVSINAIYNRIIHEYNYPKEKAALLHSDAMNYLLEKETENEDEGFVVNKYKATRNFSFPLTVCTVDQLFKFIYKYRGSEILLATLKYSKLIIDEIQAYSPEIIGKLIYGLKLITSVGGKFAIITATMPPIFEYYLHKQGIEYLKPKEIYYSPFKKRHFITLRLGDFDYDEIIEESKNKKVLIICNTVIKAQHTYEVLEKSGAYLLHSKFTQNHRRLLEDSIFDFANDKNSYGIWVTTQIVEASLDIDFDLLFTEMSTADSLLQRMGRCYRKRDYNKQTPNIIIYDSQNGVGKEPGKGIYDCYLYDRSLNFLYQYSEKIFREEDKIEYINNVYDNVSLKTEKFSERIDKAISECKNLVPGIYTKSDAEKKFRDISSVSLIPDRIYNIFNENGHIDELIETINNYKLPNIVRMKAENELKGYTINVSYNITKKSTKPICDTNIYRTQLKYDFDEKTLKGKGLLNEEDEEDNFI